MQNYITETQKAYAAGIMDGEGSIVFSPRQRDSTGKPKYTVVVISITNKDYPLLEHVQNIIGGKIYRHEAPYWRLVIHKQSDVIYCLENIMEYLSLKKESAQLALADLKSRQQLKGVIP